jgi:four helix bundle protein
MFIFLLLLKVWQQSFITVNKDRFRRAYFGIMLNIAEGSSRFSNKDRKNFMVNARGSAFDILTSAATKQ